ncbi:MAG: helix-turn-helix domain-containing protein [Vicinamibacteria bacterium]
MKKSDTARIKTDKPRGILNVRAAEASTGVSRYWPSPDLAPFIEHFWIVRWDLPRPVVAETVPHPSVHMTIETSGRAEIGGVMDSKFSRTIEGKGRVVGTKFRPGAFRPFVGHSVADFTNRTLAISDVFGPRAKSLSIDVLEHDDDLKGAEIIEVFLRALQPVADETMLLTGRIAARIAEDRSITRVDQLVREFDTPARQLQRVFKDYVGVSPKWIIQRYRLIEASERMAAGTVVDWADLALELGYSDQAHFIRDFKRFVGRTPAEYARRLY